MNPFRILGAVPILPAVGGWLTNRRNPRWRVCAPADVMLNASDNYHCWVNRVRGGGRSKILRDKDGAMRGQKNSCPESCEYCGVPVGKGTSLHACPGYRYGDGRAICIGCHATAIKSAGQLQAIWRQVARTFARLGLAVAWERLPVQMLDQPVLQRQAGRDGIIGLAETSSTALSVSSRVSLLYGMPMSLAVQTLAHEAGHVWCREQYVRFDPRECEEGFANVVACLVLEDLGSADARREIERLFANPDPVYGGHFREQWALQRRLGWDRYRAQVIAANRQSRCMHWFRLTN